MQMDLLGIVFVLDKSSVRAGIQDCLSDGRIGTSFLEPILVKMVKIMHGTAGLADHTAQCQVFNRRTIPAGRVSLGMGKIDQESGILDHPAHFPLTHIFKRKFVGIVISILQTAEWIDRAAQHFRTVPAPFRFTDVPIQIHHKRLAAAILHRLDNLADEDRVSSGIGEIVAGMHFDGNNLIPDTIAQCQPVNDQIELGREGFISFQASLAGGTPINCAGHGSPHQNQWE